MRVGGVRRAGALTVAAGPWPSWARSTASAALGFGAGVAAVVLAFADVRHAATDAKSRVDDLDPRVRALERAADANRERFDAMRTSLDEVHADVKVLLQRTAPR